MGRHWSCTLRVDDPRVPLFWLEVRHGPEGWKWRPLEGSGLTRGGGKRLASGWRAMRTPSGKATRVHCGGSGFLVLVEADAPRPVLTALTTGVQRVGAALEEVLEVHGGRVYRLGEGDDPARALEDGAVVVHQGKAYRYAHGDPPAPTAGGTVRLSSPTVRLDLDAANGVLHITDGLDAVELQDPAVLLLVPFLRARRDEHRVDGGWLSLSEAHRGWVAAGGRPDSPPQRISWDKGRLRSRLAALGVGDVALLFEKRRRDGRWQTRLRLDGARLSLKTGSGAG